MALSSEEKAFLDQLRRDLVKRTSPQDQELNRVLNEIDLTGISIEDLRALVNPRFVQGVDLNAIDTSGESTGGKFTSFDMNNIAPGAINESQLDSKLAPVSLVQARVTDIVDTQSGIMSVQNEIRRNADVEDLVTNKTKSQGINLQMINRAEAINEQSVSDKPIKSRFVEQ